MTTLTVLCEGATEKNFVVKTLSPHLKNRNVFVKPIDLGGNISVRKLHNQINSTLKSGRGHEYVTTMIDLYGLGKFPGNEARPNETARVRVVRIQDALFDEFPNPNFIPYIQLHEFEALVLVDTEKIRVAFPDGEAETGIAVLNKSIGDTEPELVNESVDTAPSIMTPRIRTAT